MDSEKVIIHISEWLKSYIKKSGSSGFVIGLSGGIDSAVTSTLCAWTGFPVMVLELPIHQPVQHETRAQEHITWLKARYPLIQHLRLDLTPTFDQLVQVVPPTEKKERQALVLANSRSRLRMTALYYFAGMHHHLVAGTGNKIEDFGIGFFTKFGDGGVDISPIGDLTKSEVYTLAAALDIVPSIQQAAPADGLWNDDRTDADQIGAGYPELENAMAYLGEAFHQTYIEKEKINTKNLSLREKEVLDIYIQRHNANLHKMTPIPVCVIPPGLKKRNTG